MKDQSLKKNNRFKKFGIAFAMLFTAYLGFGIWAVPAILKSQIQANGSEILGREISLEKASFNPLTLEAKLFGFAIAGPDNAFAEIEELAVNVQITSLLPNRLELKSFDLNGATIRLRKKRDEQLNIADILSQFEDAENIDEPSKVPPLQARIQKVDITNVVIEFEDQSLDAPFSEVINIESIIGRNVGTVKQPDSEDGDHWKIEALLHTKSGATIEASLGAQNINPWIFGSVVKLENFDLSSIQPYVDEFTHTTLQGKAGFHSAIQLDLTKDSPAIVAQGSSWLTNLGISDSTQKFVTIEHLNVSFSEANSANKTLSIQTLSIENPTLWGTRKSDGDFALPNIRTTDTQPSTSNESPDFNLHVSEILISQGTIEIEDRSFSQPFKTRIQDLNTRLSEITVESRAGELDASLNATLKANVLSGDVFIDSSIESLSSGGSLSLSWNDLQLNNLNPMIQEALVTSIQSGSASGNFHATNLFEPTLQFETSLTFNELQLIHGTDEREYVSIEEISIDAAEGNLESVTVEEISVTKPNLSTWLNKEGLNLDRLLRQAQLEDFESPPEESQRSNNFSTDIKSFRLIDGYAEFLDTSLMSTHKTRISDLNINATNLTTAPDQLAAFNIEATIDGGSQIKIVGETSALDPVSETRFKTSFSGYDMQSLSPYWEQYLARGLAKGQFEWNAEYEISNSQLKGSNSLKIDQLTLGEKVISEDAIKLPLGFVIKLLQDRNGLIEIKSLPVSGDLSSPEVSPWGLARKALMNLVTKVATAPFSFLGSLVGGREDLDSISFEIGSTALDSDGIEKIETLAKILEARPGLSLEMTSSYNTTKEAAFLKQRLLAHRILNPDLKVISVLDLLSAYDETELKEKAQTAFLELTRSSDAFTTVASAPEAPEEAPEETSTTKPNLIGKFAQAIGIKKKADPKQAEPVSDQTTEASRNLHPETTTPSLEQMLEELLATISDDEISLAWIKELAIERSQQAKSQLIANREIAPARIFIVEPSPTDEPNQGSLIKLKLTE